jgi:integrase/recombinase XerD
MDVIEAMKKEMLRRKLSHRTIVTYIFYVKKFLKHCRKDPKEFSKKDVMEYLDKCVERGFSGNSLNVVHNALRFMMIDILRKGMRVNIKYAKTPKTNPEVLSRDEVRRLIAAISNPKHKLLISLMYGAGLRVSEAIKLTKQDLDIDAGIGWVRHGKGDKDRPFIIPECIKKKLGELLRDNPSYTFTGQKGHLTARSVQEIIARAARKAKIKKNIHPHTLRHSFATHLIEAGNDVTVVQALLGHGEVRSTMTYLHMAKPMLINTTSPLDLLQLRKVFKRTQVFMSQ